MDSKGVYFIASGSVDIKLDGEIIYTIPNRESFGESKIIKQPVNHCF